MKKRLERWYWNHCEVFDFIESVILSKEVKFIAIMFSSIWGLFFISKMYLESSLNISLFANHPITDVWFLSLVFGFCVGIIAMSLLHATNE